VISKKANIQEVGKLLKDNSLQKTRFFLSSGNNSSIAAESLGDIPNASAVAEQVKAFGYAKLASFLSDSQCESLRNDIDDYIESGAFGTLKSAGNDHRFYFADRFNVQARDFGQEPRIVWIGEQHLGHAITSLFTLLARVDPSTDAVGSGGSWHQDSRAPQFKAMVYLSDVVSAEDGAFQIFPGSHKLKWKLRSAALRSSPSLGDRWTAEEVAGLPASLRSETLTGNAGDCIVFDSSSLHRGHPVRNQPRYAMTNYLYPQIFNLEQLAKQFPQPHVAA